MPDLIDLATSAFDYENFFSAKLTADMTAGDTDVFMDDIPAADEGVLVIDWDVAASREVVFFSSKTASKVVCPANGRGFDNTTATTHQSGANVIMAPVRAFFRYAQQLATTTDQGWKTVGYAPDTITHNGNRSYTLVFNSVDLTSFLNNGMKLEIPRTVTAPTSCFSLDGSNDYYVKTTPTGFSFTDDFTVGAWLKMTNYPTAAAVFIGKQNGTQGFIAVVETTGQIRIQGSNASASNYSRATSYPSINLNRWVHVAAKLDMSAFTYTNTTSQVWFDGVEVPGSVARAGTNPTALVQAGNLEIGSYNGGTAPWGGYITEVFVSSTKLTTANVQAIMNQGITSTEVSTYSLVSAYGNGSTTDINTTNANNLTATNGATTATDSPFSQGANTVKTAGTTDYGVITNISFSTNTTAEVFVPEGSTIPTTGGVGTLYYSVFNSPYGFPRESGKWKIQLVYTQTHKQSSPAVGTWYNPDGIKSIVPKGGWRICFWRTTWNERGTATAAWGWSSISTSTSSESYPEMTLAYYSSDSSGVDDIFETQFSKMDIYYSSATTIYPIIQNNRTNTTAVSFYGLNSSTIIVAECAYI